MIRINLLPVSKKPARATGGPSGSAQTWGIIYAVVAVLWCIGLGLVYYVYTGELEEQQQRNRALRVRIDQLLEKSEHLDEVNAKIEASKQLEAVVAELDKARTGPSRVMMELTKILSKDGGPTIDPEALEQLRRDNPYASFNRSWDVRRLWLTSFREENRECEIEGVGRTNEDVAEFLRRLALSELFTEVTLTKTEATRASEGNLELISFQLTCRVTY